MKSGCSFFSGVRSWEPPLCLHSRRISSSSGGAELCSCMADQGVTEASRGTTPECSDPSSSDCEVKSCTGCRTTKTPLWRAGPTGPKSLCNACGIRYRKNVKDAGLKVDQEFRGMSNAAASGAGAEKSKVSLKLQKSRLGLRRQRSMIQKHRIKWRRSIMGEVEQAAALLMALSYSFPIGLQSF